jgi:hypothetical protein
MGRDGRERERNDIEMIGQQGLLSVEEQGRPVDTRHHHDRRIFGTDQSISKMGGHTPAHSADSSDGMRSIKRAGTPTYVPGPESTLNLGTIDNEPT